MIEDCCIWISHTSGPQITHLCMLTLLGASSACIRTPMHVPISCLHLWAIVLSSEGQRLTTMQRRRSEFEVPQCVGNRMVAAPSQKIPKLRIRAFHQSPRLPLQRQRIFSATVSRKRLALISSTGDIYSRTTESNGLPRADDSQSEHPVRLCRNVRGKPIFKVFGIYCTAIMNART